MFKKIDCDLVGTFILPEGRSANYSPRTNCLTAVQIILTCLEFAFMFVSGDYYRTKLRRLIIVDVPKCDYKHFF